MWKKLKGIEPGIYCWVNTNEIDTLQYLDPNHVRSDLVVLPGQEDKSDVLVITTKHGNKITVEAKPEDVLSTD